ncbi:DEAD/DEAH box helicase [Bacteroides sedimenti]|uniref:DEAD/DEAH box helicase n=1 Tax=Bacteroides sedimenti TaxID=2136147 RepID=A0ABM8IDT4_9BACE
MLKRENMYNYQKFSTKHILSHPYAGLFLDMGLGKTVCSLTAVDDLMFDRLEVDKPLIIAPKRVAESTWPDEVSRWEHLKHLRVSVITGTPKQRLAALEAKADIYVINRENVAWLVDYYGKKFPFDMLIIDELSSFKSPKAVRFKKLKAVRPMLKRVVGLTGTPSPNSYIDLWSQLYLLDMGQRLGKSVSTFRGTYFKPGRTNGQVVFDYVLLPMMAEEIQSRISDICISMKSEDYLELPDRIDHFIKVKLSKEDMQKYREFEKNYVLSLPDEEISAVNAASLSNKLLQYANGAVYDDEKNYHVVHDAKLEALEEIIESANSPVMVAYAYKHDLDRINARLKTYKPRMLNTKQDEKDWNEGKIRVLLVHPASVGHGLNLQFGGHNLVWFGNTFSLELYMQLNKRLHRNGQKHPVLIYHLITEGTHDEDAIKALTRKDAAQSSLMECIKARIKLIKEQT